MATGRVNVGGINLKYDVKSFSENLRGTDKLLEYTFDNVKFLNIVGKQSYAKFASIGTNYTTDVKNYVKVNETIVWEESNRGLLNRLLSLSAFETKEGIKIVFFADDKDFNVVRKVTLLPDKTINKISFHSELSSSSRTSELSLEADIYTIKY